VGELVKLVIVGSQDKAWPPHLATEARNLIYRILEEERRHAVRDKTEFVVGSGESPGNGVDLWVRLACEQMRITFRPFPPKASNWPAFRARNIQMADWGDKVIRVKSRYSLTYGSGHCIDDARRKNKDVKTYELPEEPLGDSETGEDFIWDA
jgi:hypothetical protein